jgi:hypothetical protein
MPRLVDACAAIDMSSQGSGDRRGINHANNREGASLHAQEVDRASKAGEPG